MKIAQTTKPGQCQAMRCKSTDVQPSGYGNVELCPRHLEEFAREHGGTQGPANRAAVDAGPQLDHTPDEYAEAVEHLDPADQETLAAFLAEVTDQYRSVKEQCEKLARPLKTQYDSIRNQFKPHIKGFEEVTNEVKGRLAEHVTKHIEYQEGYLIAHGDLPEDLELHPAFSIREKPVYEIEDLAEVPERFCKIVLDEDAINDALAEDSSQAIPGVKRTVERTVVFYRDKVAGPAEQGDA